MSDANFGANWDTVWINEDVEVAVCPACHSLVGQNIWTGGNTLWDHWQIAHPDCREEAKP